MFFRGYPNIGLLLAMLLPMWALASSPGISRGMYFILGLSIAITGEIIHQSAWFRRIDAEKFKWR